MGAKTWIIVYSNGDIPSLWQHQPKSKKENLTQILNALFPKKIFVEIESGNLAFTNPRSGEVQIADLGELLIVATDAVALDYPSKVPQHFIDYSNYKYIYVFAMHSVVDWFAFAIWENKQLVRSLSLSPDSGIMEDIGEKFTFELDYWSGKYPAVDPEDDEDTYPLHFHPLDFGENALLNLMGYQYEGLISLNKVEPEDIEMACFKSKAWWQFW
jgi:hypothetical protein